MGSVKKQIEAQYEEPTDHLTRLAAVVPVLVWEVLGTHRSWLYAMQQPSRSRHSEAEGDHR